VAMFQQFIGEKRMVPHSTLLPNPNQFTPIFFTTAHISSETNFHFRFILEAADVRNLDPFKVISLYLLTMILALQPLFNTVFKILNTNVPTLSSQMINVLNVREGFSFSTL
jgi:hypothetical protein